MGIFFTRLVKWLAPILLLVAPLLVWQQSAPPPASQAADMPKIVEGYVKAIYSRDFAAAYRWLSSRDRNAKSEQTYVREQGAFTGFTLQLEIGRAHV